MNVGTFTASKKTASEFFGVTAQSLDRWFSSGCPVAERDRHGHIKALDLSEMARWRIGRDAKDDSTTEAEREKILLTREQRIGQELKNAQTRRELAPVSVIEWTLSKVGSQIAAILESVPMKVKKLLPKLSAAEIEHIRREVIKAQNAAARVTVDLDEYYVREPDGRQDIAIAPQGADTFRAA